MDDLKKWWSSCPIFNKTIIYVTIFLYFLSFFILKIIYLLINLPYLTFFEY